MSQSSASSPFSPAGPVKTAVITCAVMETELEYLSRGLPHILAFEVLKQGLHNDPPKLRTELQAAIDRMEANPLIEAIVLGYGLCSRGSERVFTRRAKLVYARAHDCITLLLGSKERYAQYVARHPGTYWYSHGWNLHHIPPGKERYEKLYNEYLKKFGKDDAEFLMESEQHWFSSYSRATYVDLGAGTTEADLKYTQECARWLKWNYDYQPGDPQLLIDLLLGKWDAERFVVVEPGQTIRMTADERVFEVTLNGAPLESPVAVGNEHSR